MIKMVSGKRCPVSGVRQNADNQDFNFVQALLSEQALKETEKYLIMTKKIKEKIIQTCTKKIDQKGENVGLSFYAFFANKNDNPKELMEVAEWWIKKHELNHFEKAVKIRAMVKKEL